MFSFAYFVCRSQQTSASTSSGTLTLPREITAWTLRVPSRKFNHIVQLKQISKTFLSKTCGFTVHYSYTLSHKCKSCLFRNGPVRNLSDFFCGTPDSMWSPCTYLSHIGLYHRFTLLVHLTTILPSLTTSWLSLPLLTSIPSQFILLL